MAAYVAMLPSFPVTGWVWDLGVDTAKLACKASGRCLHVPIPAMCYVVDRLLCGSYRELCCCYRTW